MAWSETARRAFYTKKYGEEEGEARFQEWMDRQDAGESPRQEGDLNPKPKAKSRAKPSGLGRKPPYLDPDRVSPVVGIGIAGLDKGIANFLYPPWKEDQLTDEEIGRLARASADEIVNSETLSKWFLAVMEFQSKGGAHTRFAIAIAYIIYPRMVRHGMIPDFLGQMPDAADVAGGGAHGDHWPDGQWEVPVDEPLAGDADAFRGAEEQGGFDQVPEEPTYTHGRRNGRSKANEDHLETALREAIAGVQ
jgi:hypothetical protein